MGRNNKETHPLPELISSMQENLCNRHGCLNVAIFSSSLSNFVNKNGTKMLDILYGWWEFLSYIVIFPLPSTFLTSSHFTPRAVNTPFIALKFQSKNTFDKHNPIFLLNRILNFLRFLNENFRISIYIFIKKSSSSKLLINLCIFFVFIWKL